MSDNQVPEGCGYTEHDEWVRSEDGAVVVGVTDYAQEQLGDIVFVELPAPGTAIVQGEPFGVIESVKAVSDLYAPISGEVVALNEALTETPEQVNEDCYGSGWLIKITPTAASDVEALMTADAYRKSVAERSD